MKTITIPLLLSILTLAVHGQQIDYNKIILPQNVREVEFREKLVQLAWKNHPSNRLVEHHVHIQKELKKQSGAGWISSFGITGNLNEFVLNEQADEAGRGAFYPKYNIYGRFDLGQIFVSPSKRREANHRIRIAEESVNLKKLEVRHSVLTAYQDYIKFLELFKMQSAVTQEAHTEFLYVEKKFKEGKLTVMEYENAQRVYNEHYKEQLRAENEYLKSKYDLEFLVGVALEEVL